MCQPGFVLYFELDHEKDLEFDLYIRCRMSNEIWGHVGSHHVLAATYDESRLPSTSTQHTNMLNIDSSIQQQLYTSDIYMQQASSSTLAMPSLFLMAAEMSAMK